MDKYRHYQEGEYHVTEMIDYKGSVIATCKSRLQKSDFEHELYILDFQTYCRKINALNNRGIVKRMSFV